MDGASAPVCHEMVQRDDEMNEILDDDENDAQVIESVADESETDDDDKLLKLVSFQNFDGSFKLDAALAHLLHTTLSDMKQGYLSRH